MSDFIQGLIFIILLGGSVYVGGSFGYVCFQAHSETSIPWILLIPACTIIGLFIGGVILLGIGSILAIAGIGDG